MPIRNLKKSKKRNKSTSGKRISTLAQRIRASISSEKSTQEKLEELKGKVGRKTHTLGENERIIESVGVVQNTNEFVFEDGSKVETGTPYHIHVNDFTKTETYMTEKKHQINSKTIFRVVGATLFGQYKKVKPFKTKQIYAKPFSWTITKKDVKRGFSYRYFVRELFGKGSMYEVNEVDGESKLPMYETIIIKWFVGENKELVETMNIKELDTAIEKGFDLTDRVSPLSGYTGGINTLENRISRLGSSTPNPQQQIEESSQNLNQNMEQTNQQISPQSSPSPSGGGSAY